jgi:hypothetical protein
VSARNTNRFYGRTSAGAYELSVDELRVAFTNAASAFDRVRALRAARLAAIETGDTPVALAKGLGTIVLHAVPLSAFSAPNQVDVNKAYGLQGTLRPISSMGMTPRINFEGFINVRGREECFGYTQIFRNGVIEATKVGAYMMRDDLKIIPSLDFDRHLLEVIPLYMDAIKSLEISPPVVILISLLGVRGCALGVSQEQFLMDDVVSFQKDRLELPEIIVDDFATEVDYQRAIRPAFDALWNAAGFSRSRHFGENGAWIGPSRW